MKWKLEGDRKWYSCYSSALTPAHPLSVHKVHFGAVDMLAKFLNVWMHVQHLLQCMKFTIKIHTHTHIRFNTPAFRNMQCKKRNQILFISGPFVVKLSFFYAPRKKMMIHNKSSGWNCNWKLRQRKRKQSPISPRSMCALTLIVHAIDCNFILAQVDT